MAEPERKSTILVGVDGSEAARAAALTAIQVGNTLGWAVHALYVVEESLVMDPYANIHHELERPDAPQSRQERLAWLQEQGERALAWIVEEAATRGVLVETEIVFGGMPDVLLQEAEKAELLALGRRGNGHAGRSEHLGRNFRTIARHSPRPLLVGGEQTGPVRRLLLAYDGEEDTEQALRWAAAWQKQIPLVVEVLVVDDDAPPGWVANLNSRVTHGDLVVERFLVEQGNPAERIVATLQHERADALLMGSYDHIGLVEWFTGSTLDQVLRQTTLPVFVSCGQPLPLPRPPAAPGQHPERHVA